MLGKSNNSLNVVLGKLSNNLNEIILNEIITNEINSNGIMNKPANIYVFSKASTEPATGVSKGELNLKFTLFTIAIKLKKRNEKRYKAVSYDWRLVDWSRWCDGWMRVNISHNNVIQPKNQNKNSF